MNSKGKQWILNLQKSWMIFSGLRVLLLAVSASLIISVLLIHFLQWAAFTLPVSFLLILALLLFKYRFWAISLKTITRFIDLHYAEVQESSSLLLKPSQELSFLEQLQLKKVELVLANQKQSYAPLSQIKVPLLSLIAISLISLLILRIPGRVSSGAEVITSQARGKIVKENVPLQISSFQVTITPPAYTGKASRTQKQFSMLAETGARVNWQMKSSGKLDELSLIFNDQELIQLKNTDARGTVWTASKVLIKPGFYQLIIAGKKSDFYQIEIIPDQPVQIRILKPAQHSTIDIGRPQRVDMEVLLQDDYSITDAYISATVASGKGEAVSFKEQKMPFNASFTGKKQVKINKIINLKELGMNPGDELYYYISATDNHGQLSRSDMYVVSIQDTAELMSLVGIDNGVNLVPEYFRSERQIIIDTEKLLKEKPTITDAAFKQRSNDLGVDQKMLRLRYGKFLGEESEANIGGDAEHGEEHDHAANKGGESATAAVEEIMDQYAHKHDNAEDATFFEPQLKAQLKATLTEMWNAELRLRTYRPEEALPYEYKALRLLKDLQQKSRAYVAKTTFKTSKLKPEKRLTGELADIETGINSSKLEVQNNARKQLEEAIELLENRKVKQALSAAQLQVLMEMQHRLTDQAAAMPVIYLPALKAVKTIIAHQGLSVSSNEYAQALKGLNNLLGKTKASPFPQTNTNSSELSKSYFNHLKRSMPAYGN